MSAVVTVRALLTLAAGYAALGSAAAVPLHGRGLVTIDPATRRAGLGFRLLVTPGIVALWPWLLVRWWRTCHGRPAAPGTGSADHQPSPQALRRCHALAWKALVVIAPLLLGTALHWRPAPPSDAPLPHPAESPRTH